MSICQQGWGGGRGRKETKFGQRKFWMPLVARVGFIISNVYSFTVGIKRTTLYAYMIYDTFFKAQANGSFCRNTCRLISLCLL